MALQLHELETVATISLLIFLALIHSSAIITQLDKITQVDLALVIHIYKFSYCLLSYVQ